MHHHTVVAYREGVVVGDGQVVHVCLAGHHLHCVHHRIDAACQRHEVLARMQVARCHPAAIRRQPGMGGCRVDGLALEAGLRPLQSVARATVAAPASASARSAPARQAIPLGTWAALWIALLATVGLGIVPGGLVQSAVDAASVLFR